jgi:hypothetical protein
MESVVGRKGKKKGEGNRREERRGERPGKCNAEQVDERERQTTDSEDEDSEGVVAAAWGMWMVVSSVECRRLERYRAKQSIGHEREQKKQKRDSKASRTEQNDEDDDRQREEEGIEGARRAAEVRGMWRGWMCW